MKVIVDKLPESKGGCKFAVCKNKYYRYNTETKKFHCTLKEAYDVDTECDGRNKEDGYIHCDEIISFKEMYKSQMKMQDCVVRVNKDGIPDIWKEDSEVFDREYMDMLIRDELAIREQLVKLCEKVESNIGKGSQKAKQLNETIYISLHKSIQDLDDITHWTFDLCGF